jgi:hypothetical protein
MELSFLHQIILPVAGRSREGSPTSVLLDVEMPEDAAGWQREGESSVIL